MVLGVPVNHQQQQTVGLLSSKLLNQEETHGPSLLQLGNGGEGSGSRGSTGMEEQAETHVPSDQLHLENGCDGSGSGDFTATVELTGNVAVRLRVSVDGP
ncbi:hypothetical protein AOLI_G00152600 [Acnodon oligacanthus]